MDILVQFILEAFMLCVVSLIVSFLIILISLPRINEVFETSLFLHSIGRPSIVALIIAAILVTSFLLGHVTNFFYVRLHNINSIKRRAVIGANTVKVLNGLVVIQLTVSLTLCTVATVIYAQLGFIGSRSPGFYTEGILEVNLMELPKNVNPASIKTEFLRNGQVLSASVCMGIPLRGRGYRSFEMDDDIVEFNWLVGDLDFVETMGFRLRYGRTFLSVADTNYTLLNETAAKRYGFDVNLHSVDPNAPDGVIGIVHDFNFKTLHNEITPVIINYVEPRNVDVWGSSKLLLRVKDYGHGLLSTFEDQWKDYFPDVPFEYTFLTEEYGAAYSVEKKQSILVLSGCVASIAITMLGVIGLLFFSTYRRSKEMAIRQVYGATSLSVLAIFVRQVFGWIAIASLVSVPLALYIVATWMNSFVYKAELPFFLFSVPIFCVASLTLLSVLYQIVKASFSSPIDALKME